MSAIFICYRREDSGPHAGRLYDRLSAHFGRKKVFRDIDTMEPGQNFEKVIRETVGSCDVLIAVIGKRWLVDAEGRRRLEDPKVPAGLVALWVKDFETRVSSGRSWSEQLLNELMLRLRTGIEVLAEEQKVAREAFLSLINLVKKAR